jgi:hypothetical protein
MKHVQVLSNKNILINYYHYNESQDSSIGKATGYEFDCQGENIFLYSTASRPATGLTQPPVEWVTGPLSPEGQAVGTWSWPFIST